MFFMFLSDLVSSDIVMSPSSSLESLSVGFGRFMFFFNILLDIFQTVGRLYYCINFCKIFQFLLKFLFDLLIYVLLCVSYLGMILLR